MRTGTALALAILLTLLAAGCHKAPSCTSDYITPINSQPLPSRADGPHQENHR